jgi:Tol biopolymer transport system component
VLLIALSTWAVWAEPFTLISQRDASQPPPAGGNGDSWGPNITPDGRFVVFASTANNLTVIGSNQPIPVTLPPRLNVYRRDRVSNVTVLVSVNLSGTGGGDNDSVPTGISTNGQYVVFESAASDLVAGDTNGVTDIFVRDLVSNATYLVSVSTNGGFANGLSRSAVITPDGQQVAFVSAANNLVENDTNGIPDVFVRDLQAGVTQPASVGAVAATAPGLIGSESPQISADGRYVAFYSTATNLVPGVGSVGEIYICDLLLGTTTWASTGSRAALGTSAAISFNHAMSADGRFVAYEACANPRPFSVFTRGVVLRFALDSGLTDVISTNAFVSAGNVQDIHSLDLSPDGRFVAFTGNSNGAPGTTCIYIWDALANSNTPVSVGSDGAFQTNAICDFPAVDASGRFVAFLSTATNLVVNTLPSAWHLFLRDVQSGVTTLLDADTNGAGSPVGPHALPRMSADGWFVAFECPDASLVADDRNKSLDVFLRDTAANSIELISARAPSLFSMSANGPSAISSFTGSTDGRFIAFTSDGDNLVSGDTNGYRDVFVRDLFLGTTILASSGTNGVPSDGASSEPSLSADGRYLAFSSTADNLISGDTNRAQDVFLKDLQTGLTSLVSVNRMGTGPGNSWSVGPTVSGDGRFVLFRSAGGTLTADSIYPGSVNLFLRDRAQTGTTYALTTSGLAVASMTPDGHLVVFADGPGNSTGTLYIWDSLAAARRPETNSVGVPLNQISISPNGAWVACFARSSPQTLCLIDRLSQTNRIVGPRYGAGSRAGLSFSADGRYLTYSAAISTNSLNQVYLLDLIGQRETQVSVASGSTNGANAHCDSPVVSADGRFVVFRSSATDLLSQPANRGVAALYLYDRQTAQTRLLTAERTTGALVDNGSLVARFSLDGHTLLFHSWASALVPQDLNSAGDVFALSLLYVSIVGGTSPGSGPTLTWPARPGEHYRVQFRGGLGGAPWQDMAGSVTITGNQAQSTDPASGGAQRYYRITAD